MLNDGELEKARFELEDETKKCQQDSDVPDAGDGKNEAAVMEHYYWLQRQKVEEEEEEEEALVVVVVVVVALGVF